MCGVETDIQGCYTYAFQRYAALTGGSNPISKEKKPCQLKKYSSNDHERDRTQGPSIDGTSFFQLLLTRGVDWVLASSRLVGELLVLLAKLEFGWHFGR